MELKVWLWSSKDGYGVEKNGYVVERMDMQLKGWIWS